MMPQIRAQPTGEHSRRYYIVRGVCLFYRPPTCMSPGGRRRIKVKRKGWRSLGLLAAGVLLSGALVNGVGAAGGARCGKAEAANLPSQIGFAAAAETEWGVCRYCAGAQAAPVFYALRTALSGGPKGGTDEHMCRSWWSCRLGVMQPTQISMVAGIGVRRQTRKAAPRAESSSTSDQMRLVPEGEFLLGSSESEADILVCGNSSSFADRKFCELMRKGEIPQKRVYLSAFYMDQHEVTDTDFERFTRATGYQTEAEKKEEGVVDGQKISGADWLRPRGPNSRNVRVHPVSLVTCKDAKSYCEWTAWRLPASAEWEKAARGSSRRRYPWGDTWRAGVANVAGGAVAAVGTHRGDVSPYEIYDMAGNVAEWVSDLYHIHYYETIEIRDPKGPDVAAPMAGLRVRRGASWRDGVDLARTASRLPAGPPWQPRWSAFDVRLTLLKHGRIVDRLLNGRALSNWREGLPNTSRASPLASTTWTGGPGALSRNLR